MRVRALFGVLAAAVLALMPAGTARAHEVRPALVQIVETAAGDYQVTFKRPVVGDQALRLAPHLSSGAIDVPPAAEEADGGHLTRIWRIRGGPPLEGQTLTIQGLSQSVTDTLVRVSTRDGRSFDAVLKPSRPSMVLKLDRPRGLATPAYLRLGVEHILTGFDHLLFVLGLFLLVGLRWRLIKAITAFTVGHSLTLAAAALGLVHFPPATIEALVALSIVFVAREALRPAGISPSLAQRRPWVVAFTFGLLHGLAFASALSQIGLPPKAAVAALLLFNLGVEMGQLAFIGSLAALVVAARPLRARLREPLRPAAAAAPGYLIGVVGVYWVLDRTLAAIAAS